MHERNAIYQLWQQCENSALATVVEVKGSAYRRPGARMLLTLEGRSAGMINGGCLDHDLHLRAQRVMATGQPEVACYDTTAAQDIVFGLGLGCRGVVQILVEPAGRMDWIIQHQPVAVVFEGELGTRLWDLEPVERPHIASTPWGRAFVDLLEPPQELLIFGAGADAVPLHRMGQLLGWNVRVVDLRAAHPQRPLHGEACHIPPEKLPELEIAPGSACVIMTHNFLHDFELLKRLLPSPAGYIGILGPRRRTDDLLAKVNKGGLVPGISPTPEQLSRLYAPIGLSLGAETPEEIALSIVAEIQRVRRGACGQSLRERSSIHE